MVWKSSKWGKFGLSSSIWSWRSGSISPQNNRDLNQGLLLLWSKFRDSSLHGSQVTVRTSKWLTHRETERQRDRETERQRDRKTERQRDRQTQTTTIPKGQNWPQVKIVGCNHLYLPYSSAPSTKILMYLPHRGYSQNKLNTNSVIVSSSVVQGRALPYISISLQGWGCYCKDTVVAAV